MKIKSIKTRIFRENEDLIKFVLQHVKSLKEESVLVITSKIVALSEGRTVELDPSLSTVDKFRLRTEIIKKECDFMLRTKHTWLTLKDGIVMSSAGVDESNADGKIILLPKDSFKSAAEIRTKLKTKFKIKNLGILITDSRLFPLRAGIVGVALGYAGFKGVRDYRKTSDIFGRKLKLSRTDIADGLATSAVLCMGEGKEQRPLALITDAPVVYTNKTNQHELYIDYRDDLYGPLFSKIKKVKIKKHR